MKKVTLLLLIFLLVIGASGGYGYYAIVLEDDTDDTDDNPKSSSPPIARINPSNPKIQANETIPFSASDSTDSDGDTLTFTWIFEGDSEQYSGETIERTYPDGGDFYVNLLVTDSTGLTDESETTVSVVEDYYDEVSGNVEEGQSDQIEFPVQEGAVSVYITWDLDDDGDLSDPCLPSNPCSVNLILNDSDGNALENVTGEQEGQGSWSVSSDRLEFFGNYEFIIEGESGKMAYNPVTIDVSYT